MQETWVRSLVWEDPTRHGATKPMSHILSLCSRTWEPQLLSPQAATIEACMPYSLRSVSREVTAMRGLCAATREEPLLATAREETMQ